MFCCDNPLLLVCVFIPFHLSISAVIKYSFEGRLPALSQLSASSSLLLRRPFISSSSEPAEQPVPLSPGYCTCVFVRLLCVTCTVAPHCALLQASIRAHYWLSVSSTFQPAVVANFSIKPPWEINTISTARYKIPKAHNVFKRLSSVILRSLPAAASSSDAPLSLPLIFSFFCLCPFSSCCSFPSS